MKKAHLIIALLILGGLTSVLNAQWLPYYPGAYFRHAYADTSAAADTVILSKWEPHLSVSTGFLGTSFGDNRLFTSVAPSLAYRPNDKWTILGGFRITTDMGLNPNYSIGTNRRSLAPYKTNGGTGLASGYVEAQYQVNENFWLAGSVYHMGGHYAPLYGPLNGEAFNVSATAISAAAAFRFSNNNLLHVSFTYIRDHAGTMPFMLHDAWLSGGGYGSWGMFASPTDYYRMAAPYSPMFFGGWY